MTTELDGFRLQRNAAERIQAYLRETARRAYDAVPVPPFTAFFHPGDGLVYFNYAIPDTPAGGDLAGPLARLRAEFAARARTPRFEFVEGVAPELSASLRAAGFLEELRTPLMTCAPRELLAARGVTGLRIEVITEAAPIELVQNSMTIARRAFGSGSEEPASREEAEDTRRRFAESRTLVGRLDGEPIAVATAVATHDGLSEVAGVAVLAEFRRRGIGSAMTAAAAGAAFAAGAELAFLTPGDEGAERIYERAGFRRRETMLVYTEA